VQICSQTEEVLKEEDILGVRQKLIVLRSWGVNQIFRISRVPYLPQLNKDHLKAKMYKEKAHWEGHQELLHGFRAKGAKYG
jgi:hypothetical protein